jgi:membrane protease YdiL (CAAX protease family)
MNSKDNGPPEPRKMREATIMLPEVPWTKRDMRTALLLGTVAVLLLLGVMLVGSQLFAGALGIAQPSWLPGTLVLVAELGLLVPVWALGTRKYHLPWSSVGFRRFDIARAAGFGCLSVLGSFGFNALWALFLGLFRMRTQPDVLPVFGGGIQGLSQALLVGGVVAPVAEEAFFRGYLFAGLRSRCGRKPAIVMSAAMFSLAHIYPTSWPPIFVLGALFALLYEHTQSIWPAVVVHGGINAVGLVASYLLTLLS